jgi:hypothetical protein
MKKILISLVLLLFLLPVLASATTYYVSTTGSDTNPGTQAQPWKTIAKVNALSFSPGDFILFKRGETWYETLIPPSSGSAGSPITFGAYGSGDLPTIDGTGRDYCVEGKKDYITITDLHFTSPNQYGIVHTKWTSNGTELSTPGWVVQNCLFTHCRVLLFGPNTLVQDNVFVGPSPITGPDGAIIIRGLVARNCSVLRNTISGYYSRGIWFLNGADSPTANDNVVHDIANTYGASGEGYGINFDGYGRPITGTVTASRNTIYNCAGPGIFLENCVDASLVNRNLIHDCTEAGWSIGVSYMNYAASSRYADQRGLDVNGIVKYNIIYHCNYGIRLDSVSGVDIWNNVLYDGVGSYPGGLIIFDAGTYFVDNIDFRNNIIGSGMTKTISTSYAWENHFSAFDNNLVVNPVFEERDTWTHLSLAQLQAGSAALNCFTTSPGFVDAVGHDFHLLSSSPCINKGANVGLTKDYEGNTVPQGAAPDVGAYEYLNGSQPLLCTEADWTHTDSACQPNNTLIRTWTKINSNCQGGVSHPATETINCTYIPITYYVSTTGNDNNAGTSPSAPWAHCPGMVGWTGSATLRKGDVIYFRSQDTFICNPPANYINCLETVAGVTYDGASWGSGTRAKIQLSSGQYNPDVISVRVSNVTAKGLEVDGNSNNCDGIIVNAPSSEDISNIEISNCVVHHNFGSGAGSWHYGILAGSYEGHRVINVSFLDNIVYNVFHEGILLYPNRELSTNGVTNALVRGNEVYNTGQGLAADDWAYGAGILIKDGVTNAIIEYNYLHDNPMVGIQFDTASNAGAWPTAIKVRHNLIRNSGAYGIYVLNSGAYNYDFDVYGNIIAEYGLAGRYYGNGVQIAANGNYGSSSMRFYSNTFYSIANVGTSKAGFLVQGGLTGNPLIDLKNNIFYSNNHYAVSDEPGGKITRRYNLYYRSSGASDPVVYDGGVSYSRSTVATWDLNAKSADPLFIDALNIPTDISSISGPNTNGLALQQGSPAIDTGFNLGSSYATSIDKVARPQGSGWDIGAYEYVGGAACVAADINCDSKVDVQDLIIVASDFGKTTNFNNSKSDTNGDNIVDIYDVVYVASRFT